jgi:hypothetical protein
MSPYLPICYAPIVMELRSISHVLLFCSIKIINVFEFCSFIQNTGEINDISLLHRFHIMQPVYWHIWHPMEWMLGQ